RQAQACPTSNSLAPEGRPMSTIGIVGANGQVGSEVCLFLSRTPGITVVPICRSRLAGAFLTRCGLTCRYGAVTQPGEAARLLEGCDLVADFTMARGLTSEMRETIRGIVTACLHHSPAGSRFVYTSSEMAYGMRHQPGSPFRHHLLSRTVYGASKRYGEAFAMRIGRATAHEVYALRLGQVHGELQNVTLNLRASFRDEAAHVPDALSDTVFAFSIAEALAHIAAGKESPGLYTLISTPQWSWKEVHEHYARECGAHPEIVLVPPPSIPSAFATTKRAAIGWAVSAAGRYRDVISGYLLHRFPALEARVAATYRSRTAAAQVRALARASQYRPYDDIFAGAVQGNRLRSLSDSRTSMQPMTAEIRQTVGALAKAAEGARR
ncbi:MAG: NAD-dependent epimerase/dehydratase family protein, partial [Bryobacteraceae bacterium]